MTDINKLEWVEHRSLPDVFQARVTLDGYEISILKGNSEGIYTHEGTYEIGMSKNGGAWEISAYSDDAELEHCLTNPDEFYKSIKL